MPLPLSETVVAGQAGHIAAHNDIHDVVNEAARINTANTYALEQKFKVSPWYDVKAYGAVGDGVADDTAAIQSVIDLAGTSSAGVPGIRIYFPPGTYKTTATLNIHMKSLIAEGAGLGNPTNYATQPGKATTLMWAGAAAGTMFNIQDAKNVAFRDIFFQGNTTNVPAQLIYYESAGGQAGTNEQLWLDRCHFGGNTWTTPSTSTGTAATRAVRLGGSNANNDQFHFSNCEFWHVATGIAIDNSQSVWGLVTNCTFNTCTTAGISTAANLQYINCTFNACAIDVKTSLVSQVMGFGHWTEGATQVAVCADQSFLAITGGLILNHAGMSTNCIDVQGAAGNTGGLYLACVRMMSAGQARRKIKVRGIEFGGNRGSVTIIDCLDFNFGDLDIVNVVTGDTIDVNISTQGMNSRQQLRASETLKNVIQDSGSGTPEGVITAGIGSTWSRTDGGAGTSFYVKESGTGNTGWVAK